MRKKLSIIIPVYNGERFIEACLNSLVKQALNGVEIIVINDGSTDLTGNIITTTFKTYIDNGSLIYLPTENGGVSAARNHGIDNAVGDYIAFVDADDLVGADYIQTILAATAESPSIIEFGYRSIDQHGNVIKDNCYVHTQFGKNISSSVINSVFSACIWYPFLRVFKREFFKNNRFLVGVRFCEDLMALSDIYRHAEEIYTLPRVLYEYRINPDGATLNIKSEHAIPLIAFYRSIKMDNTLANKALKIATAYAIRRCTASNSNSFGSLPFDIQVDIAKLVFTPKLLLKIRYQFVVFAIFGSFLNFTKWRLI